MSKKLTENSPDSQRNKNPEIDLIGCEKILKNSLMRNKSLEISL
jgi:hypothetical protein